MNVLDHVMKAGLRLSYSPCQDKIRVRGLDKLSRKDAAGLLNLIKVNKRELIEALKHVCPFTPEDLATYAQEYPDLVCCPRRKWMFVYERDCGDCHGHKNCLFRPATDTAPNPA